MLKKTEIQAIIDGIISGLFSTKQLPKSLYISFFEDFETSLLRGLSVTDKKKLSKKTLDTFLKVSTNLRNFAAAKTYQVVKDIGMLTDADEIADRAKLYMRTWQDVEKDLVVKQGQTINQWATYQDQKDVMPYLKYVTAQDERVRHSHVLLNGIIKPVDDPFWDDYLPLNGYRCRCTVEQLEKAAVSKVSANEQKMLKEEISSQFRNNPAKTGFIFKENGNDKHPYFDIPEKNKKAVKELI